MPYFAKSPFAFGSQLLNEDWSKPLFPVSHRFMSKVEASEQEEFGDVTKTHLIP